MTMPSMGDPASYFSGSTTTTGAISAPSSGGAMVARQLFSAYAQPGAGGVPPLLVAQSTTGQLWPRLTATT
jgi:hypothetical protein